MCSALQCRTFQAAARVASLAPIPGIGGKIAPRFRWRVYQTGHKEIMPMDDRSTAQLQRLVDAVLNSPGASDPTVRRVVEARAAALGGRARATTNAVPLALTAYAVAGQPQERGRTTAPRTHSNSSSARLRYNTIATTNQAGRCACHHSPRGRSAITHRQMCRPCEGDTNL